MDWSGELGMGWGEAAMIVLAALGIYAVVILYSRVFGQRSIASYSTFDFVVTIAIGAIVGRVVLVRTSLAAGALGLGVLFLAQAVIGRFRNRHGLGRVVDNRPYLLMRGREILRENLRRAHLGDRDLREKLRASGITRPEQVGAVVMERSGSISVLRADRGIDPWILADIPGGGDPLPGDGSAPAED